MGNKVFLVEFRGRCLLINLISNSGEAGKGKQRTGETGKRGLLKRRNGEARIVIRYEFLVISKGVKRARRLGGLEAGRPVSTIAGDDFQRTVDRRRREEDRSRESGKGRSGETGNWRNGDLGNY